MITGKQFLSYKQQVFLRHRSYQPVPADTRHHVARYRWDEYAYIEDYANLVVNGDWSDAILAAFDTGKDVVGIKGKEYRFTKS